MFPEKGQSRISIKRRLDQWSSQNIPYHNGMVFNSICTEPLAISRDAFQQFVSSNLGDHRIFRGSHRMEEETILMLGDLYGNETAAGNLVTGGTEANLLALYAAKQFAAEAGKTEFEVIAPKSVHFSVMKAAKLMGIRLVLTGLDGSFRADPQAMEEAITENTIALLATAGTSELGMVDPYEDIGEIAARHHLYYHIDAASGGFLLPFLEPAREIYLCEPVCSITVDPHKYGFSAIQAGAVLFRNRGFQRRIQFDSFFEGTGSHTTFSGTRSGAGTASAFAAMSYLGKQGYRSCVKKMMETTRYAGEYAQQVGLNVFHKSDLNILALCCRQPETIQEILESEGWIVSVVKKYRVLRLVFNLHNTLEQAVHLLDRISGLEKEISP